MQSEARLELNVFSGKVPSNARVKPIIAITPGDPAGIGPEIVIKSLADKRIYEFCRPLVVGDAQALSLMNYGVSLKVRPIVNPAQGWYRFGTVDVLHLPSENFTHLKLGEPSKISGVLSARAVRKSIELALSNLAQGLVHAPISKVAWKMAGERFPGHTEMIADLCGVKKFAMAIGSGPLRTVLVTRHLPLKDAVKILSLKKISESIELAVGWLNQIGVKKPRIGVCALNPHAGEKGLLGQEEIRVIAPAIRLARKKMKAKIFGPLPADSAFRDHKNGLYDALITMYHDQSLIPLKLFDSNKLINITLGLPFPRVSPGHGTAFDIAGKKLASAQPMIEAIHAAALYL